MQPPQPLRSQTVTLALARCYVRTRNTACQVLAAMLTVLAATLGRVPTSVMRAKLAAALQVLSSVVEAARDQVRGGKPRPAFEASRRSDVE
jgi:uncharacterized membrane protein